MTDLAPTPISTEDSEPAAAPEAVTPEAVTPEALAAFLAARMCHDYISPAGAIVSGLDLLDDPSAQDMREDALGLIATSAKKLVALLQFDRIAFGASAAAESFDVRALEALTRDVFAHIRAELTWTVEPASLPKPAARVLMNLAQITGAALPIGGIAALSVTTEDDQILIHAHAAGPRARLRPEVVEGLNGRPMSEGLGGHWVQAYYLHGILTAGGGTIAVETELENVNIRARLPA
jgi:histidine phosphotransferase ChpT